MKKILSLLLLLCSSVICSESINLAYLESNLFNKNDRIYLYNAFPYEYLTETGLDIKKNTDSQGFYFNLAKDLNEFLFISYAHLYSMVYIFRLPFAEHIARKDLGLALASQLGVDLRRILVVSDDYLPNTSGAILDIYSNEPIGELGSFLRRPKFIARSLLGAPKDSYKGPRIFILDEPVIESLGDAQKKITNLQEKEIELSIEIRVFLSKMTTEMSELLETMKLKLRSTKNNPASCRSYMDYYTGMIQGLKNSVLTTDL